MQHLNDEELARLVDEGAEPHEAFHLTQCDRCRAELRALREQSRALSELPDLRAPRALWSALEARLQEEELVREPGPARRLLLRPGVLRIAAALALFVGGAATGAVLSGAAAGPPVAVQAGSPAEAAEAVRAAEGRYLEALTRYAELTGAGEAEDPVNRLAALEGIVLTARAALQEAPADPVINGYLLTAMSQRDAILRRISAAKDERWF